LKYLRLKNKVQQHVQELKENYLKKSTTHSTAFEAWKAIKKLSGAGKDKSNSHCALDVNRMNDIFSESFQNDIPPDIPPLLEGETVPTIGVHEVTRELSLLQDRKACGIDGLPNWIFKQHADALAPAVTILFNCSMRTQTVPAFFKAANVTAIPKCPSPTERDFRPISLLVCLSKVLEKLIARTWIIPSLIGKLDPLQFAFVPGVGKGTTCALTLQQHIVLNHLDTDSGAVRMLQVDLRKAFDKIPHKVLLDSMLKMGVPSGARRWTWSFLTSRYQRVKSGGDASSWISIPSGVPQGSVLGPLLFAVTVNSLHPVCDQTTLIKYADDLTFLHCIRDASEDGIDKELANLEEWSTEVGLPINFEKTNVLDYITARGTQLQQLTASTGVAIEQVTTTKLLGMHLSADMKWNRHYDQALKKASGRLHLLRLLARAKCPRPWMLNVYNALIRSVISYGFPAACNIPKNIQQKFTALERRAERIVGGGTFSPSILEHLNTTCLRLAKKATKHAAHPLHDLFPLATARNRRNNNNKYAVRYCKTKRLKDSFVRFSTQL
jgi:hypothetical protein